MTRRRWIADEFSANRAALTGAHADHLICVLRAKVGQEFDIAVTDTVRRGRITAIHDHRVEFDLGEEIRAGRQLQITLALAIFKFDRMEWAIEKCTELGVARLVPLIAHRTDAHLAVASAKRVERWRRIARQASEQSRRISPPEIAEPLKLREAVGLAGTTRIVLAESEEQLSLKQALQSYFSDAGVTLAVGPEGGWTLAELELFGQSGWISASLGDTILRAETAAIAAIAIVSSELQ
ncbi:MAG TPA: RsmE family RNA methyltransferase [Terriglobales bacterium]|nr:RsmE family RNA methyltransferase [Terriglobales bacterium]